MCTGTKNRTQFHYMRYFEQILLKVGRLYALHFSKFMWAIICYIFYSPWLVVTNERKYTH